MDVKVVSPPRWWEARQKKLRDKIVGREATGNSENCECPSADAVLALAHRKIKYIFRHG